MDTNTAVPVRETPARDASRRPHRSVRALVERDGHEAPRVLYAWFDVFNAVFFAGKLGAPLIWVSETSSPRARGDYIEKDVHGLQSRIRIAPRMFRLALRHVVAVLLHEMVHAWCYEVAGDTEEGYRGHGPVFAGKCNEIGRAMGFPEVAPKGRHGKKRAESWPHLPAVEGEEQEEERKRAPRAPRAPGGAGDSALAEALAEAEAQGRDRERGAVVQYLRSYAAKYMDDRFPEDARIVRILTRAAETIEKGEHAGFAYVEGE